MHSRLIAAVAFILCLCATSCAPALAWDIKAMNTHIDQSNFVVNTGCSGTLIDLAKGYVLTANHCVADQYETVDKENVDDRGVISHEKIRRLKDGTVSQLDFKDGDIVRTVIYKVKVVAVDATRDLALLQVKATLPPLEAAVFACTSPARGEVAYVIGNPMGTLYSSVVKGIVSSLDRNYDILKVGDAEQAKQPLMQISSGVIGGNSGGSVYNDNGEMIGVPVMAHRTNEIIGFAVPLDQIKAFLADKGMSDIAAVKHCAAK